MKELALELEFITPCFCMGADQRRAEIRAPSLRGELRWWFRVLGGSPRAEREVFGGVHGETRSSAVILRAIPGEPPKAVRLPEMRINQPLSYIWYFANASGKDRGQALGPRFQPEGYLSPGQRFTLRLLLRRDLPKEEQVRLERALRCLASLGTLGFRASRAAGAWRVLKASEGLEVPDTIEGLRALCKTVNLPLFVALNGTTPHTSPRWEDAVWVCESLLRALRQKLPAGKSGDRPSPLGGARPRQRSAVHLRPVRYGELYQVCAFYTPAVLGRDSADPRFTLAGFKFAHPFDPKGERAPNLSLA